MPLTYGARVGPYEIVAQIGAGGMGVVYRARDTRLNRGVALKVLPDTSGDPDRLARFQREAQVLASLNHPNIGAIYGLEEVPSTDGGPSNEHALVLELIEGPTLADVIRGQARADAPAGLPIAEALTIAVQIAEALEAAHDIGIVHRDLKPANIIVQNARAPSHPGARPRSSDGRVKVLDFGLAKLVEPMAAPGSQGDGWRDDRSQWPTLYATVEGTVLGTAPYMSPEQARGLPLDERTDIWALGCVLFEMLTGRGPFHGTTVADTLARILEREPDWDSLPAGTPPAIRTLLRRCLEKDRNQRLSHISEAREAIARTIGSGVPDTAPAATADNGRRLPAIRRTAVAAGAVVVLGTAAAAIWFTWPTRESPSAPSGVSRVSINPSPGEAWVIGPHDPDFAISPDGERIAYIGRRADGNHLVIRRLNEFDGLSLGRFSGVVRYPFFSPDGKWVAFADNNVLKKAAVDGSVAVNVGTLPGYMSGAAWGRDNVIIFGTLNSGLFRIPASGGDAQPVATRDADQVGARWPVLAPDEKAVLFASVGASGDSEIWALDLATGKEKLVVSNATFPRFAGTGHLLYVANGVLWGVRFDAGRLATTGEPVPVVDGVMIKGPGQAGLGAANVGIADNGTLVYRPSASGSSPNTLVWVDRNGGEEPLALEPRSYGRMQLAPDGSMVAIEVTDATLTNPDIWVGDVNTGELTQLTFEPEPDTFPLWTPDGRFVIFRSDSGNGVLLNKKTADGSRAAEPLSTGGRRAQPFFVTPDGLTLVYGDGGTLRLPLGGESTAAEPVQVIGGPVAALSPDGRWMANSSDESGDFEVYVQPYPNPEGTRWRVSSGGGRDPLWSRDGRELFYQHDTTMFATVVTTEPTFAFAPAVALFDGPYVDALGRWYDVAPDGRFLMIKPGWLSVGSDAPLNVVLNWHEELARALPR